MYHSSLKSYQEQREHLIAVNFTLTQAEAIMQAAHDYQMAAIAKLATKQDLADVRAELKQDIAEVRGEIKDVRAELKLEIADVRSDIKSTRIEMRFYFVLIALMTILAPRFPEIIAILSSLSK